MTAHLPSRRSAVVGAFATLALAGCSSTKGSSDSASGGEDAQTRLKASQDSLAKTPGYHVKLTSKGVPTQETSFTSGEGDVVNSPAAFKGKVSVNVAGAQTNADVVNIGKDSWVKTGSMASYRELALSDMGVPLPSSIFSATTGLPALPTLSKDMKKSGEKLVGGEKVTTFKGTVDGTTATKAIGFGQNRGDYTLEVGLTPKNEAKLMTIAGPFFASADATYTIEVSNYGQKATITKP